MLFVALWLWLDQPWLWALAEALALTYGLWVCGARGCRRGGRGESRTKGEPAEQSPPPPSGKEGGGLRSPRMRARRTQAARKEKKPLQKLQPAPLGRKTRATSVDVPPPFSEPGPSQTRSSSQGPQGPRPAFAIPPRRQTPGLPLEGPEARGRLVVEAREWLGQGKWSPRTG